MCYFSSYELFDKKRLVINKRKFRNYICGFFYSSLIYVGDVLSVSFQVKNLTYFFEGICISVRKKYMQSNDTCFFLRNKIFGVGIEYIISYYVNRVFDISFLNFKRKFFISGNSKLYYIRLLLNRSSTIL